MGASAAGASAVGAAGASAAGADSRHPSHIMLSASKSDGVRAGATSLGDSEVWDMQVKTVATCMRRLRGELRLRELVRLYLSKGGRCNFQGAGASAAGAVSGTSWKRTRRLRSEDGELAAGDSSLEDRSGRHAPVATVTPQMRPRAVGNLTLAAFNRKNGRPQKSDQGLTALVENSTILNRWAILTGWLVDGGLAKAKGFLCFL